MVNPYAVNSRQTNKPKIQLGQSQAIKKFEKFQAKYSTTGTTSGSKKQFKKKKNSDNDSDDDDDDDDDSLFKNAKQTANKFMKKKQSATPIDETETDSDQTFTESKQSDISVDIDRSSTPIPAKRQQKQQQQQITKIPTSRIRSATSSVSSIRSLNRRSVKFVKTNKNQSFSSNHDEINDDNDDDDDDESTIIDEVMSNLILDIDDLEASTSNLYKTNKKKSTTTTKRLSKSPLAMAAQKRSESVTSIIEDNEEDLNDEESKASSGSSDKSLSLRKNLILDVNELARSLSEQDDSSLKKKKQSETDKKKTKKENKSSDKNRKKEQKNKSRKTPSIISESKSTIDTESITDNDADVYQDEYTKTNQISESENELTRKKASLSKHRYASARQQQTYNSDFETEATLKSLRKINKPSIQQKRNAEIQVDPTDLLKNSEFLTTVNVYNPSSILLATTSHLNTASTLKDLNQLTGYTMINQAFNDLMKMNLSFVSNFLTSQRNLYEQQIKSIRPKEYNN